MVVLSAAKKRFAVFGEEFAAPAIHQWLEGILGGRIRTEGFEVGPPLRGTCLMILMILMISIPFRSPEWNPETVWSLKFRMRVRWGAC